MIRNKLYRVGLVFALIMSVGLTGCDSDDDDANDGNGGSGGSDDGGNGGSDDGGDGGDGGDDGGSGGSADDGVTFSGRVIDVVTNTPVPGIDVIALSNDADFTELSDPVTTDDDGNFTIEGLEDGLMCVRVAATEGDAAMVDTFSCNVETDQEDLDVASLPLSIAQAIAEGLFAGEESDPNLTSVSGGVYYLTEDGIELPVDCATLEVEEAIEDTIIFYMEGVMPSPDPTQTDSMGRFLISKIPGGLTTVNAYVGDEKIGSVTVPLPTPADYDVSVVSNVTKIIADEIGDPSPGTCD